MNRIGRRILVTGLAFCLAAPVLPGAMMVRATEPAATTKAAPSEEEINAAKEKLTELLDKYSGEKIKQLVSDAIKKINQKDDITTTWLDDLIADTEEQAKIWGAQTAPTTPMGSRTIMTLVPLDSLLVPSSPVRISEAK